MKRARSRLPALFAAMGAFALAAQTLLFREYLVSFQGNELGIAIFFSTWLFWIASGAALATRVGRRTGTARLFLPLTVSYPIVFSVHLVLLISIRPIAGVEPFELFALGPLFLASLIANAPVSLLTGFLFQAGFAYSASLGANGDGRQPSAGEALDGRAARLVGRPGQLAATLYAFEAFGSFLGGLLVTGLLWRLVPPLLIVAGVSALLMFAVALVSVRRGIRWVAVVVGSALLALIVATQTPLGARLAGGLDDLRWLTTFPTAEHVESLETPYQKVSVGDLAGQTVVLTNGKVLASSADGPDHATTAAMLLAQNPDARRVLVIGMGSAGLVPYLTRYAIGHVDYVTVDGRTFDTVLQHSDSDVAGAFEDDRVEVHVVDPRDFVTSRSEDLPYDIVFVGLPDPDTVTLNRFYTTDFYRSVATILTGRGVFATRISAGENYAGTEVIQYGRSIYQSLAAVFDHVEVTPGERAWLLASRASGVVSVDSAVLEERFRNLSARDGSVPPEAFSTLVPLERVESTRALFRDTGGLTLDSLLNTDSKPVTLYLNLLVLGAQSGASIGQPLRAIRAVGLPLFLVPIVIFVLLRLYFRTTSPVPATSSTFNGAALLAVFGAVSMCLSIILLISFQNRFGHVFLSIGLLSALFMLGLFVGGLGGTRVLRRVQAFHFWPAHVVCAPVVVLCLSLPLIVDLLILVPSGVALVAYHALFVGAGVLCGAAFPVAGFFLENAADDAGWVAGALESADHWGGAIGAAVVGVVVVPVLGVSQTCFLLAVVLGAVWLCFAGEQVGQSRLLLPSGSRGRLSKWLRRERRRHRTEGRRAAILVITGVVLAVVVTSNLVVGALNAPNVHLDERWIETRYHALDVAMQESPFVHYRVSRGERRDESDPALLLTRAVAPDVEGYGGPINLLVVTGEASANNQITFDEVTLAESHETPAYIAQLPTWLEQFDGWPMDRPITGRSRSDGGAGVDVITGATVTSTAVLEILERTRVRISADIFDRLTEGAAAPSLLERLSWRTGYVVLALLLVIPIFLKAGARARDLFLVFNLIVAGFWLNLQFSFTHVTRILAGQLPSLHAFEWLILTVGLVVLAVGFGSVYCGYLCPFGAAQELLGRLGFAKGAHPVVDRWSRQVKFGVLAVALLAFFAFRSDALFEADPLQVAFGFSYAQLMVLLLLLIGIYSLFYFRFWCRYLCPVGAFFAIFNKVGIALRFARPKVYRRCELGQQNRWDFDCLQCNRCIAEQISGPSSEPDLSQFGIRRAVWRGLVVEADAAKKTKSATRKLRRPVSMTNRDSMLLAGILLALLIVVLLAGVPTRVSVGAADALGQPRDVDVEVIRRQIQENRLSDHEALYYQQLDDDSAVPDSDLVEPIPVQ